MRIAVYGQRPDVRDAAGTRAPLTAALLAGAIFVLVPAPVRAEMPAAAATAPVLTPPPPALTSVPLAPALTPVPPALPFGPTAPVLTPLPPAPAAAPDESRAGELRS